MYADVLARLRASVRLLWQRTPDQVWNWQWRLQQKDVALADDGLQRVTRGSAGEEAFCAAGLTRVGEEGHRLPLDLRDHARPGGLARGAGAPDGHEWSSTRVRNC